MDREKISKDVEITIKLKVKPEHCETILQEHITVHNDDLITGIYRFLLLKEETYINGTEDNIPEWFIPTWENVKLIFNAA